MSHAMARRSMVTERIPKRIRDWLRARYPLQASRLRSARNQVKQIRGIDARLRSLERGVYRAAGTVADIHSWECSIYSQNGEDGILMHLFSRIGGDSFRFLEFGCGNGLECNTANLALGFGWGGLLLDADSHNVATASNFLRTHLEMVPDRVSVRLELVTPSNVNGLIAEAMAGADHLDLLSIDVDGNDYWIWNAVDGPPARVVVVEYNATFGPSRSVSVRYDDMFDRFAQHNGGYYHGASLEALRRLGVRRGYQLVGCDSTGVNAFFVLSAVAGDLPSLTSAEAFVPLAERALLSWADQFAAISHLPLIEV